MHPPHVPFLLYWYSHYEIGARRRRLVAFLFLFVSCGLFVVCDATAVFYVVRDCWTVLLNAPRTRAAANRVSFRSGVAGRSGAKIADPRYARELRLQHCT